MLEAGAAIVDIGGESTRPGAEGVTLDEELRRVMPVLEGLQGEPVSIDTAKADVARRALGLGAELVNDVTALRGDPDLAGVVAEGDAYLCLMHMQGERARCRPTRANDDVVSEVKAFLEERLAFAVSQGVREELVCLDPGSVFGKTAEHNFELVRRLDELCAIGRPVLVGFSRKSTLGKLMGDGRDRPDRCGVSRRGSCAYELEVVLRRLAKTDPRIETHELFAHALRHREREPLFEERLHLGDDVVVARVGCIVRGSPCMCMRHRYASPSATTPRGQDRREAR